MSITKYKVIQKNLEAVINYAKNGEKTEYGILVSGVNCLPENAYAEMTLVKKNFHKEDGRLGYHFIQSFNGKEVTAMECHEIGMELANSLWGDKYQVLVCTHIDKDNVHNHIILNSVSFIDGSKYHNSNAEIALVRETNDDLCRKNGLSVVETDKANKENEIAESRISNYNRNSGKMELIKNDIDEAIKNATKYQDFINELEYKGYFVKRTNNSISLSTPYFNRNIRIARSFGEDYSYENIKQRIYYNDYKPQKIYNVKIYDGVKIDSELLKKSHFYRIYVHFLYVFGKLPPKIHYEERTPEYYKEIDKFNKLCDELSMISSNDIKSTEDAQSLRMQYLEEVSPLKAKREEYRQLYNRTSNAADKTILNARINHLTEDIDRLNIKIQTCRRIINKAEMGEKEDWLIQKRIKDNIEKSEIDCTRKKNKEKSR